MTAYAGLASGLWPDTTRWLPPELLSKIGAAAVAADRSGQLATESLELLRANGWTGLTVPERFHGNGLGLLAACATQRALGAHDPGLAIALTMHISTVGLMVEHWRRNRDAASLLMEAIATQNRVVASAFAEPSLGGSVSRSTLRARRVPGGWRVTGRKSPCSLALCADLVLLQLQTADEPGETLDAVLPTATAGLTAVPTWDTLGMRGSGSDTIELDDCFIPDLLVFHRAPVGHEDDDLVAAGVIWFCLNAVAVYLGLAQQAMALGQARLNETRIAHLDASRAALPSFQAEIGDQVAALLSVEAACAGLAGAMDGGAAPRSLLAAALSLKQQATRVVPTAVERLVEACGGAAYGRESGLARLWRDAQAIRFHPPTPFATRQHLGRRAMGLPAGLDLDEDAPQLRNPAGV